jgi:hypothetical protein
MKKSLDTRLKDNLRRRLSKCLKGHPRKYTALQLLGCDFEKFKKHIERQFKEGMNWDNYGTWHIDHIVPCMNFNFKLISEQKKCFNYKNLRPLCEHENRKRKKIEKR